MTFELTLGDRHHLADLADRHIFIVFVNDSYLHIGAGDAGGAQALAPPGMCPIGVERLGNDGELHHCGLPEPLSTPCIG